MTMEEEEKKSRRKRKKRTCIHSSSVSRTSTRRPIDALTSPIRFGRGVCLPNIAILLIMAHHLGRQIRNTTTCLKGLRGCTAMHWDGQDDPQAIHHILMPNLYKQFILTYEMVIYEEERDYLYSEL
jgi:hypothetical protein